MALTPLRWAVAAIVGAFILTGLVLREHSDVAPWSRYQELTERASAARQGLDSTMDQLRLLEIRDSLAAQLKRRPAARAGELLMDKQEPSSVRRYIDGVLIQDAVVRPGKAAIPVDIAVVYDSGRVLRGYQRGGLGMAPVLTYFLPGVIEPGRCLVLLTSRNNWLMRREMAPNFFGPCAFYKTFGAPGPAIDRWLRARGLWFAQRTRWTLPTAVAGDDEDLTLVETLQPYLGYSARAYGPPEATRCVTGVESDCTAGVLGGTAAIPPAWGRGIASWGRTFWAYSYYTESRPFLSAHPLGSSEAGILSEMVRTLGPEKFARFWRSDKDVATAFQEASGMTIGAWTRQWAQRAYGQQYRGPGVDAKSAGVGIILLAAGLFAGLREGERRTFV